VVLCMVNPAIPRLQACLQRSANSESHRLGAGARRQCIRVAREQQCRAHPFPCSCAPSDIVLSDAQPTLQQRHSRGASDLQLMRLHPKDAG